MPRRGYTLDLHSHAAGIHAQIGRRASESAGQRAALRLLARLIRRYPRRLGIRVDWDAPDAQKRIHSFSLSFDGETEQQNDEYGRSIEADSDRSRDSGVDKDHALYRPVTKSVVQRVARHNGTLRDLTRYGAVDMMNSVQIDLGLRPSYDAGGRATMRTLARRLQSPFNVEYSIVYRYSSPQQPEQLMEVLTNYSPLPGQSSLDALCYKVGDSEEQTPLIRCSGIKKRLLIKVGQRSGNFADVYRWASKAERKSYYLNPAFAAPK